jgi:hypothetical protein
LQSGLDLSNFGASLEGPDHESGIIVPSGSLDNLNALIDHLRQANVQIASVERHRRSLEAGFLDIIDREEKS